MLAATLEVPAVIVWILQEREREAFKLRHAWLSTPALQSLCKAARFSKLKYSTLG